VNLHGCCTCWGWYGLRLELATQRVSSRCGSRVGLQRIHCHLGGGYQYWMPFRTSLEQWNFMISQLHVKFHIQNRPLTITAYVTPLRPKKGKWK
jgi:hypothetical protein